MNDSGKFSIKERNRLEDVGNINYLKFMKRETLVDIWLKLADSDRKEAKNQKWVFEWYSKGANMHENHENS